MSIQPTDPNALPLTAFLQDLFLDAHARVPAWKWPTSQDQQAAIEHLRQIHHILRLEAPGRAPDMDEQAALWGAQSLHWCCWMLLNRLEEDTRFPAELGTSSPHLNSVSAHWSVDLTFRFFASVLDRARQLSHQDRLCETMENLILDWPLSAIGCGLGAKPLEASQSVLESTLIPHDCLRFLLRDRILARQDRDWVEPPAGDSPLSNLSKQIQQLVRDAIGSYDQLCPAGWNLE